MGVDETKARAVSLAYKKSTQGLTDDEERELQQIKQKMAIQRALVGSTSPDSQKPEGSG